jgi:hypothetical protein
MSSKGLFTLGLYSFYVWLIIAFVNFIYPFAKGTPMQFLTGLCITIGLMIAGIGRKMFSEI